MKISRNWLVFSIILFLWVVNGVPQVRANDTDDAAAEKSAVEWLSLVDESHFAQSWEQAAPYFKSMVTKSQWETQVKAARQPMGKLISRTVKSKQAAKTLPGAPDGEYVVLQFETKFENKTSAVETITPQKDKDGKWRVCGYFIR